MKADTAFSIKESEYLRRCASHDIRQPLHALSMFTDSLEKKLTEQDELLLVSKIKQSAVEINKLISDYFEAARSQHTQTSVDTDLLTNNEHSKLSASDTPLTILILDNNLQALESAHALLSQELHNVCSVSTLQQALKIVVSQAPDILVIDNNMNNQTPENTAIEQLKSVCQKPFLSIVTSENSSTSLENHDGQVAHLVLQKPLKPTVFLNAIQQLNEHLLTSVGKQTAEQP